MGQRQAFSRCNFAPAAWGAWAGAYLLFAMLLLLGCSSAWAAESKRVMLLHSFGRDFKPWSDYAKSIREELDRQSPWPLDITEHSLVSARSGDDDPEGPFVEYLRALFAKHPLDLIVSIGAPAANFVQRHRERLFANTPMVFTAVEQRRLQFTKLTINDAVVAVDINYLASIENILRVLPDTKNITVVAGVSPIEQFWRKEIEKQTKPLADRVTFSWIDHLPFDEFLKQAAAMPPGSAIFWELMIVDAAGVVHEGSTPLTDLHAVANAPIFSYDESFFGREIVGGPLLLVADTSRQTAAVGIRILGGEKAGDINVAPVQFARPMFDWREMNRWGISESRLLPGSDIRFRDPTAWQRYPLEISAIAATILLLVGLIGWLIYEHWRRNAAELTARNAMANLMQMNRIATAGEISGSIAHEVNQPLSAISASSAAALNWLRTKTPDIDEIRSALTTISDESLRAGRIVQNLRAMFRKDVQESALVEIDNVILAVLELVHIEMQKHRIEVQTELSGRLPPVVGHEVQLQQVVFNLVINAKEAMQTVTERPRTLNIKSQLNDTGRVQISIEDSGTGISSSDIERVFDPAFTTKATGMGMGLSICRTIIESHGGTIWATRGKTAGSIFSFALASN
jgi:signal transduction histidine kinase